MKNLRTFKNLVDSNQINEEVSKQTLYHYTTLSNLYLILKSNKMIARSIADRSASKWRKISSKSISFCRKYLSMDQLYGIQDGVSEPIRIIIHFDYEKLKENYKIVPWSDERTKDFSGENVRKFGGNLPTSQFEERITSDIINVKKYITRIEIIYNEIIMSSRDWDYSLKNDSINLSSGKDDSQSNLPWNEFISSDFFKKSMYSVLSLDKNLKRNYHEIIKNIIKHTGQMRTGNSILGSGLLISLWNWWLFQKTKSLASGITFDFQNKRVANNKLNMIKLNSSEIELMKSISSISDLLLKNFKELFDEQVNQIHHQEEYEKKYNKGKEKEETEKQKKELQKQKDIDNQKKWKEEFDRRRRIEFEELDKKEREKRRKIEFKLNNLLEDDKSYIEIRKWWETNIGKLLIAKSDVFGFFNFLETSVYEIEYKTGSKDEQIKTIVQNNSEGIYRLLINCQEFRQIEETVSKCKELINDISKSLDSVKISRLSKIKKFFQFK